MNETEKQIQQYLDGGRIPWSPGFKQHRMKMLQSVVNDLELLKIFKNGWQLPARYGFGIDERIVEYPWVLSRLDQSPGYLMDAGSTLNYPYLLDLPAMSAKKIIIMTLAPEHMEKRANVSYIYGDLRHILIRDNTFEWIVCISTIEHVGMDNTKLYTNDVRFMESSMKDYGMVMSELRRILKKGGRLLLTVPFGRSQNFEWMQQFDVKGVKDIVRSFGNGSARITYFKYTPEGWFISDAESCQECEYFDVHSATGPAEDRAAAARAVACMEFIK